MRPILLFGIFLLFPIAVGALTPAEIKDAIADHQKQIDNLDKEIAQYKQQLDVLGGKKTTLQNTIQQLDISGKKLNVEIQSTKSKISERELEISQLASSIVQTQGTIADNETSLSDTMRRLQEYDTASFAAEVLKSGLASATWKDADHYEQLQRAIHTQIEVLKGQKQSLSDSKSLQEQKKQELEDEKKSLQSTQGAVIATRNAQAELLKQTKSQESNYQQLIKKKKAAKDEFENALTDLEAKLKFVLDASKIAAEGHGILRYPVDNVRITQKFGNTDFARAGGYNGKGHNGIDLGVPVGTPVKAADSGTVIGTGNTDIVAGCYSYGRWIMIKHDNGLATLYGHLSQSNVSQGQTVGRGDLIGYSGMTGYATGPHVHFGVYVSSAVQITRLGEFTKKTTPCSGAVMPIAPLGAYLNPLNYL